MTTVCRCRNVFEIPPDPPNNGKKNNRIQVKYFNKLVGTGMEHLIPRRIAFSYMDMC